LRRTTSSYSGSTFSSSIDGSSARRGGGQP
jgi:hypothetical protein